MTEKSKWKRNSGESGAEILEVLTSSERSIPPAEGAYFICRHGDGKVDIKAESPWFIGLNS